MNAAPLCCRGACPGSWRTGRGSDRPRRFRLFGRGVSPVTFLQNARHDVAASARDSNSTMPRNPLSSSAILSLAVREMGPEEKTEFSRQELIFTAIIGVGSGEAPLDKSKSVSFEVRRTALQEHRFQIGENVYFTSRPIGHMVANSIYQVVKLLPSDGSDYQYRIKNPNEAFERVARESQLENSR